MQIYLLTKKQQAKLNKVFATKMVDRDNKPLHYKRNPDEIKQIWQDIADHHKCKVETIAPHREDNRYFIAEPND